VAPASTYWYWVKSFNGAGDNGQCSNAAQGTTANAPAIDLTIARAYKVKGVKHVDLTWDGATSTNVDIVRGGAVVATVPNNNAYTDNTRAKGGGSIVYQVCEEGSSSACSPEKTAVF
jgi:hypothetical protein